MDSVLGYGEGLNIFWSRRGVLVNGEWWYLLGGEGYGTSALHYINNTGYLPMTSHTNIHTYTCHCLPVDVTGWPTLLTYEGRGCLVSHYVCYFSKSATVERHYCNAWYYAAYCGPTLITDWRGAVILITF